MGASAIHQISNNTPRNGGRYDDRNGDDYSNDKRARLHTTLLRGAMLLHRVGEFAILAVIAIAMLSFLSVATVPRISVHALAPTTSVTRRTPGARIRTRSRAIRPPLIPLKAADTSRPPTTNSRTTRTTTTSVPIVAVPLELPRIAPSDLETLRDQGYVVVDDFLTSESFMEYLREDVMHLRQKHKFKVAKIGQDSTNTLNEEIRVAETCFLGSDKPELREFPNPMREKLYEILETLRMDLEQGHGDTTTASATATKKLDPGLSEFLYAYYPTGGFYRRHRDAVKGSASWLREYSLLLYLNEETYDPDVDGGRLRVHFDTGGDFLPAGEAPLFQDIDAFGGTLVIFESNKFPHEVLDTVAERFAVVGWYNRPMSLADLSAVTQSGNGGAGGGGVGADPVRLVALAAAAGLVTVGLINILAS